jgi:ribosomal protein S27E
MGLEPVPCELCGNQTTTQLYFKFGAPIAKCDRCGLIFANPRLSKAEIMRRYSPDYFWQEYLPALGVHDGKFNLDYFDARYASMLSLIAGHIPPPGKMLEIGTGAGFFLKAAERAGWSVDGIEVSQAAVEFANSRLDLRVKLEEAEALTYPDNHFDVIIMFEVIEHLF